MREKYTPTLKLYCMIANTEMVVHSIKYDLRKISLYPASTTSTVRGAALYQLSIQGCASLSLKYSGVWLFINEVFRGALLYK